MRRTMLATAAVVGLLGLLPGRAEGQQPDVALVYRLLQEGRMMVFPATGPRRPAQLGERLKHQDTVATSENTRAALRFVDDGSILRINPRSRVLLTTGGQGGALVRTLELEFGEVWARVNRRGGAQFRIQTPAGVAAVKGTEFVVRVDSAGVTVITLEGVVEFFNDAGRTDVSAGRRTSVTSASDAPEAADASPEELRAADQVGGGDDGASTAGTWIEVQLQDPEGRIRTLMLQVPADALRGRIQGAP
ncbi:MAG TPA: FecR family protein [Longimicrobium sp.]|uniref:FecR family protein n=1 Tax=Longimicrobium sp. TaxID=2029185 RepID=UPI002ED9555F